MKLIQYQINLQKNTIEPLNDWELEIEKGFRRNVLILHHIALLCNSYIKKQHDRHRHCPAYGF